MDVSPIIFLALLSVSCTAPPEQRYPDDQEPLSVKSVVVAIRNALVGSTTYHAKQPWHFDPEVSSRRAQEYQAVNGPKSAFLIERLGLGEDGREEERRAQQVARDIGVPITGKR